MTDNQTDIARALASVTEDVAEDVLPPADERAATLRKVFIRTWIKRVKADNNLTTSGLAEVIGCSAGYINNELIPLSAGSPKVDTFIRYVRRVSNLPVYRANKDRYVRQICQQYFDVTMRDIERDLNENLVS